MRDAAASGILAVRKHAAPTNRMREILTSGSVGGLAEQSLVLPGRTFEWDQLWPKAIHHRSLGQRPRNMKNKTFLAEGHPHVPHGFDVNMAFGQTNSCRSNSWGVAPGYGEKRPSASQECKSAQLQKAPARDTRERVLVVSLAGASG
jgi:hypothetical protein